MRRCNCKIIAGGLICIETTQKIAVEIESSICLKIFNGTYITRLKHVYPRFAHINIRSALYYKTSYRLTQTHLSEESFIIYYVFWK